MKRVYAKLASAALAAVMTISCVPASDFANIAPLAVEVQAASNYVGITQSQGWLESAWVEWTPSSTSGVAYYKVSYSGTASGNVDDKLVRRYKDGHWRADLVGLKAGSYTIKVDAYNSSNSSIGSETASVTVSAHDRTGFTFSPSSTDYDSSDPKQCGGYKGDGTPKADAEIIYITSASDIDNVTDSTGTKGLSTILQGRDKRTTKPLIVRIVGKIDYSGSQLNSSGYIQVKPSKAYTNMQTTIEGVGKDATINFGFLARNAGNVEFRNMAIHDFGDDGLSLDTDNCNIWIHNNEFFYGVQGSGDKAKGDGSSDVKNDSQFVTLSYNHYWDAGKCSLCGMKGEGGDNYITYHHNWFDHSDSRHPRIRTMFVHVYNNYYDGNAKYGVGASENSNAFLEGNYFRNCKYPTLQGSVGCDADGNGGSATLDDSNPIGAIKMWNNTVVGANSNWTTGSSGESSSNADAVVATSRNQSVSYTTAKGATYRNTDVSNSYIQSLASVVQQPEAAKTTVEKYAGRVGGGDFATASGFAFTSADDTDYAINSKLRSALTNYCNDSISSQYAISSVGGSVNGSFVPEETQATTKNTEVSTEATTKKVEGTTEATTKKVEGDTESTTKAPVVGSGLQIGDYTLNKVNAVTGHIDGIDTANIYGSDSGAVKVRQATYVDITPAVSGKITFAWSSNAPAIYVVDNGNEVAVAADTSASPVTFDVQAGTTYRIRGSKSGGNTNLTTLSLVASGAVETTSKETTTETTTVATTQATTVATTQATTKETTTESTTQAPVVGDLTALAAGTYDAATMISDTAKFKVTNNSAGTSATTQIKISETGSVQFKVNDNATVTVNFKCGSTNTTKSASISLAGKTSNTLAGGAAAEDLVVSSLAAGTYTITAAQTGGTTAQIVSLTVAYGGTTPTVVKGDADGDKDVDKNDVTHILAYVVGKVASVADTADVTGDGKVTVEDAYKISQKVLGIISSL